MFWKHANTWSLANKLVLIYVISMFLILVVITGLLYPPMKELLYHSQVSHEHLTFLLTKICLKKFFIGIWLAAAGIVFTSYFIARHSMRHVNAFSKELASINAASLEKRLEPKNYPKELQTIALTCNNLLLRIDDAFKQLKQFSASIAHELRNPVHYLQNATEVTLSKTQTVETYQQLLSAHLDEYQHLTKLIDDLLFLSRNENGQVKLRLEKIKASQLVKQLVEYYQYMAEDKGIQIVVTGESEVWVDIALFKRVLANVLDNAISYTQFGGSVTITITESHPEMANIKIIDTGIGIPKEHIPYLFQGFYRSDNTYNQGNNGLGLGLAIAKSIMARHQGDIIIDSQVGIGTTVDMVLPRYF